MFKHYKLKPSFPIITDNKTKDRAGVGDRGTSPHPQILADQLIPNLIQFFFHPSQFDPS